MNISLTDTPATGLLLAVPSNAVLAPVESHYYLDVQMDQLARMLAEVALYRLGWFEEPKPTRLALPSTRLAVAEIRRPATQCASRIGASDATRWSSRPSLRQLADATGAGACACQASPGAFLF